MTDNNVNSSRLTFLNLDLKSTDRNELLSQVIDLNQLGPRMLHSLKEIGSTIESWPRPRPPTWSCWPTPIPGGHVTLNVCAPHRERASDSTRPPGAPALSPCSQPMLSPALSSLYHSLTHLSHSLSLCSLSLCSALCSLSIGSLCHSLSGLCSLVSALSRNNTLSAHSLTHALSLVYAYARGWVVVGGGGGGGGGDLAVRGLDLEGLAGADAPRA